MSRRPELNRSTDDARAAMLAGLPVAERRLELAGVSAAVWEGGDGPPMLLLHGPGKFAAGWLTVLPALVGTHHVVVPALPGHGASPLPTGDTQDSERVLRWLVELIEQTCPTPPVLVGRVIGGRSVPASPSTTRTGRAGWCWWTRWA